MKGQKKNQKKTKKSLKAPLNFHCQYDGFNVYDKYSDAIQCEICQMMCFLILRLGAPTGILRGGSTVFKRFGPLNLLTFLGGGGPHPVISRMSLSVFYPSEPNAYAGYERLSLAFLCRSLLPGLERLVSDFRKLSMASSCRILPAFDLQSSRLSLAFLCRSHPHQLPTAVMKTLSGFFTPST